MCLLKKASSKFSKYSKVHLLKGGGLIVRSFLSQKDKTKLYKETVAKLRELSATEGAGITERAYAEGTWEQHKKDYLKNRGLKPTNGRVSFGRLIGRGKHYNTVFNESWMGHVSLLIKDGHPEVFISQPYHLNNGELKQLIATCDEFGLDVSVGTWPSWHFPGAVLTVEVKKASGKVV